MDLKIKYFDNINVIGPQCDCTLHVEGVDASELVEQLGHTSVLKSIDAEEIVKYYDTHDLIYAIDNIPKFIEVYGKAAIREYLDLNGNEEEQ